MFSEKDGIMFGKSTVSDKELSKTVRNRLQRGGSGGLTSDVREGTVTLKGRIRYESQRRPLLKIVRSIAGVRNVIDQLEVAPGRS
jgi:osmotically-inducible protein OsmY